MNIPKWARPSDEQQQQALLVQHDVIEVLNRLAKEGIDRRIIMAGLGSATADLITCSFGPQAVAPWFDRQAEMVRRAIDEAG